MEIGDLTLSRRNGTINLVVQNKLPASTVVRQTVQPFMKQRQPVLDTGMHPRRRYGFVKRIAARHGTEGGTITGAEHLDGIGIELEFGNRPQNKPLQPLRPTLRRGVETPDRLKLVTEEIQTDRCGVTWREDIDNAAAKREFPSFANGIRSKISLRRQKLGKAGRADTVTRRQRQRPFGEIIDRRHALHDGIDGCDKKPAAIGVLGLGIGKTGQRRDTLSRQCVLRRQPVEGKTVPGREQQRRYGRAQPCQRVAHGDHAGIIPCHENKPFA